MFYYHIIFGIIFAILYSNCILPEKEGEIPKISITIYPFLYKGMIIIPISNKKALHIHHWIICLILLLLYNYMYLWLFVFLLGLIIQGISYKDCFTILVNNPYFDTYKIK